MQIKLHLTDLKNKINMSIHIYLYRNIYIKREYKSIDLSVNLNDIDNVKRK